MGIRPSFSYSKISVLGSFHSFDFGPFARYYLLKADNIINVLVDGSYSFSLRSANGRYNRKTANVMVGPVVYFNSSVGLEFLFGYSTTKVPGFSGRNNGTQFGVGFQFHFNKEK